METMGVDFGELFGGVYSGTRVLVTGHTGFKGSWLALWLSLMGARVCGYALPPESESGNFVLCGLKDRVTDLYGDIRNRRRLREIFDTFQPEVVFHLAAQPIVRISYARPSETFDVNVSGTVNVLENIRASSSVRAAVLVTSDKCYENREQIWGYRETDALGGFDPYSASKACAEIVAAAYRKSYSLPVSTVRAGNVIGGGDWAADRILPDCIRALQAGEPVGVRNPDAVRPWQFVLEPLYGYLLTAAKMLRFPQRYSGAWNFGPEFDSVVPVRRVVETVLELWGEGVWKDLSDPKAVHEAGVLNLDCTKSKALLGWRQRYTLQQALEATVFWYRNYANGNAEEICEKQIAEYCSGGKSAGRGETG